MHSGLNEKLNRSQVVLFIGNCLPRPHLSARALCYTLLSSGPSIGRANVNNNVPLVQARLRGISRR